MSRASQIAPAIPPGAADGQVPAVPVVEATRFSAFYPTKNSPRHVVDEVGLRVEAREFVALIGPSGCGKSTILRALAGLHRTDHTSGSLRVCGGTVAEAQRARNVALMFQRPALMPWLSLVENVRVPLRVARISNPQISPETMLSMVGLDGFADALPRECSGGMQQRAAIARSLILTPSLLLMDEPFGALDEITRERLNMVLLDIWRASTSAVVFVTHSLAEAVFLADRVVVMSDRPTHIKGTVAVTLPRQRSLEIRGTTEFVEIENQVRALLYGPDDTGREHEQPGEAR